MTVDSIRSEVFFLAEDDLYQCEKPYTMRYPPHIDIPQSNIRREGHVVDIHNMRHAWDQLTFNSCGFGLMQMSSEMSYHDFADDGQISSIYGSEIKKAFKQKMGATHVYIADFTVRRRHAQFPISTGENYQHQQPTALAHIDYTREEGERLIRRVYGPQAETLLNSPWQIVNAWRPLRGPLNDWPLALCDSSSVDFAKDLMPADIVYPNWATENQQIHYRSAHKWFYLPDQTEAEILIFKSATSEGLKDASCPHSGFFNPHASDDEPPRESIECRAFLFYAEIDQLPPEVGTITETHL